MGWHDQIHPRPISMIKAKILPHPRERVISHFMSLKHQWVHIRTISVLLHVVEIYKSFYHPHLIIYLKREKTYVILIYPKNFKRDDMSTTFLQQIIGG